MSTKDELMPFGIFMGIVAMAARSFEKEQVGIVSPQTEEGWQQQFNQHLERFCEERRKTQAERFKALKAVPRTDGDGVHSVPVEAGGGNTSRDTPPEGGGVGHGA